MKIKDNKKSHTEVKRKESCERKELQIEKKTKKDTNKTINEWKV